MENHTFTHTPRAPHIVDGYEDQRNFASPGGAAGLHLGLMRFAGENVARIQLSSTWVNTEASAKVMSKMTADQLEEAARAFVDAAHDLRTHNSIEALHRAIVAAEGAAS